MSPAFIQPILRMISERPRLIAAGRMKYMTNGKLSAVPPHMAMDMI